MRNLLWTATAMVVMLVGVGNVMGQATTVVPANAGGAPPLGKTNVKCTGTYALPGGRQADLVKVDVYEKSVNGGGQVVWTHVTTITDIAPAAGTYTTAQAPLTTGTEHMFTATLWTQPIGGGKSLPSAPSVTVTWTP